MVYQGFTRIRIYAVAAIVLSFSLAGIYDVEAKGPYYSLLAGKTTFGTPLWLQTSYNMDDVGRQMWYHGQCYRFQIVEHQTGPLGFTLGTIVAVGGTMWMKGGDGLYYADNIGRSPSGSSILTFDLAEDYWSIRGESWWNSIVGYSLGLHRLRKLEANKQPFEWDDEDTTNTTYRFLIKEKALYIEHGVSGGDIDLKFRCRFLNTKWIISEFNLDAPIMYMICAPIVFFGGLDKNSIGTVYAFGIPRLYALTAIHIGPLALRGSAAAPTRFLVVPWYFKAAELSVTGGLCF